MHPLWAWLKEQAPSTLGRAIKWNFTKFLVDREGTVVARFEPTVKMDDVAQNVAELL